MAEHSAARGSGTLLTDVDVAVLDRRAATLCAAWWLTELGAAVSGPPQEAAPSSAIEGLAATADRRLRPHRPGPSTYVVRSGRAGELGAVGALGASTVLTILDPLPDDAPSLDGWSGAAAWATSGMASLTWSIAAQGSVRAMRVPDDDHAAFVAGSVGVAVLLAVEWAARSGRRRPGEIDVDLREVLSAFVQQPVAAAQLEPGALPAAMRAPGGVKRAIDDLVFVQAVEPTHWARLIERAGGVDGVELSSPPTMPELIEHRATVDAVLDRWVATAEAGPLVDGLQAEHIPAAPVSRPTEMVQDVHLRARSFFQDGEPTVPWTRTPIEAPPDGPNVGDRRAGACRPPSGLPLEGLRVLDLTWAWAGPYATTILADLGAEVVNIEWYPRPSNLRTQHPTVAPDTPNGCGWWSANQRGKLSVGVDLKSADGVRLVRDLAAVSDVAIENFSAGVAERLGVGAADLQRRNPALVYASLSAFGAGGPHAHWIGYGTQLLAASGMSRAMMAAPDDVALTGIPYPDPVSGLAGAIALLAAVGRGGARLDVSMLEATCVAIAGSIAGAQPRRGWTPAVVECADGTTVLAALPDGVAVPPSAGSAAAAIDASRAAGGDAVAIATAATLLDDERLVRREFWRPDLAPRLRQAGVLAAGPSCRLDGERPAWWRGAPDLFQDTVAVLRDVLRYEADEIDSLVARGAVAIEADAPASGR